MKVDGPKIIKGSAWLSQKTWCLTVRSVLVLTQNGYIKHTQSRQYKTQKRSGVGVVDLSKEEDVVTTLITASISW